MTAAIEDFIFELIANAHDEAPEGIITIWLSQTGAEEYTIRVENEGAFDSSVLDTLYKNLEEAALVKDPRQEKGLWLNRLSGDLIVVHEDSDEDTINEVKDNPRIYRLFEDEREALEHILDIVRKKGREDLIFVDGLTRGKSREAGEFGRKGIGLAKIRRHITKMGGRISIDIRHRDKTVFKLSFKARRIGSMHPHEFELQKYRGEIESSESFKLRRNYIELLRLLDRNRTWLLWDPEKGYPDDMKALGFYRDEAKNEYLGPDEDTVVGWLEGEFSNRDYWDSKLNIAERIITHRILSGRLNDMSEADQKLLYELTMKLGTRIDFPYDFKYTATPALLDKELESSILRPLAAGEQP